MIFEFYLYFCSPKILNLYVSMLSIKVKDNESIDKALKRFKKKFERAGIMREYRGRAYFEKESVTRRNQVKRASYRQRKISKREQE